MVSIIIKEYFCVQDLTKAHQFKNKSIILYQYRPFCGRVTPHDKLGLVPTKNFDQPKTRKSNIY